MGQEEVLSLAQVPTAREAVGIARMRAAARITAGPMALVALLQSSAGDDWRGALEEDLGNLRAAHPRTFGGFPPEPAAYVQLWASFPGAWAALLRRHWRFLGDASAKIPAAEGAPGGSAPRLPGAEAHRCAEDGCAAAFGSSKALRAHVAAKHGHRREARFYTLDSRCPVCRCDFRTRLRAIEHLHRGAAICGLEWRRGALPRFPAQAVSEVDARDSTHRRTARRSGRDPLAGLPMLRQTHTAGVANVAAARGHG